MVHRLPPLTWFRSFEAAARHLSFTAAADELGLTQSAISQQVRSLEIRLGVELFIRMPRGLGLTDEGRLLLPRVGASLDQLSAAVAAYDAGPKADLLTVAASVSVTRWLIAPHLDEFIEAHPGHRIRLLGTIWPDDFKASIADVEIRFGSQKQVGRGAERLLPDDLIAVTSDAGRNSIEHQVLVEAVGTSEGWRDWAKLEDLDVQLEPGIHVDTYGAALDLAVSGAGVSLTSSLLAAGPLASGDVFMIGASRVQSTEGYFLEVRSDSKLARAFGNWIISIVSKT